MDVFTFRARAGHRMHCPSVPYRSRGAHGRSTEGARQSRLLLLAGDGALLGNVDTVQELADILVADSADTLNRRRCGKVRT